MQGQSFQPPLPDKQGKGNQESTGLTPRVDAAKACDPRVDLDSKIGTRHGL